MSVQIRKPGQGVGTGATRQGVGSARAAGMGSSSLPWLDAESEVRPTKVLMEVYGDSGTGRTTFALSAPGPIALIHASEKITGIVEPWVQQGKRIRLLDYGDSYAGTDDEIAAKADRKWTMVRDGFYDAFGWARTIVLDTHSELWELLRLARFGNLKPSGGRVDANWGPVNNEWRSLFKAIRAQERTNVIVIGQTKDEYKKSAGGRSTGMGDRTGNTIRAGQKEVLFLCDVSVRTGKEYVDGGVEFFSIIEKGWFAGHLEGTVVPGEISNFPSVMEMITSVDWVE